MSMTQVTGEHRTQNRSLTLIKKILFNSEYSVGRKSHLRHYHLLTAHKLWFTEILACGIPGIDDFEYSII